ncbi:transposase [Streptomyces sp. TS71-3]|nr:transposase [Streptomyces sp. TS71-3]GHJ37119.1 transposase [Streptomyces sp. TS71-3]GHJ38276.1 transposase [Streptomyces sp. TS71-3]GHJ39291.1 transposase [Streptomyces sp. TS71-3]GHJ41398.1 transposase [Streptomyces sp. TS71-3]
MLAVGHLGELTQVVPFDLVDEALASAGGPQLRIRRLPSRVVVYLLLAGALFTGLGWSRVWSRLTASLPLRLPAPAPSSITAAMRRVGPKPLKALFDLVKGPAAVTATQAARFAGRLVVAIDGTQIALPDTPANLSVFLKAKAGPNGPAGYPMLRLVALVACGTRTLLDAVFGTDLTGELTYADRLVTTAGATGTLRPGMLLLGDRNFSATAFVETVASTGADFLIRAKTHSTALKLPVLRRLPDGTFLSRIGEVTVRVIDATITVTPADHAAIRTVTHCAYRLVTSLLDPDEAPAAALARLYHERWEIETSYCELKSTILGGRVLRGRHPAAVTQETWALLVAYQALRTAMSDAVLHRPDIDPDRAAFTVALHAARDQIVRAAGIVAHTRIDLVGRIGTAILDDLLPARRNRTRPRVKKRAINSKYRAVGRDIDHRTHRTTVHIAINPLPSTPYG